MDSSDRTPIMETKSKFPHAAHLYDQEGLTHQYMVRENAKRFSNRRHLGVRSFNQETGKYGEYQYITFGEVNELVTAVASGLRAIGLNPKDKFGIMSKNTLEWTLASYACSCQSIVSVPVYESYGLKDCEFICCHSEIKAVLCTPDKVQFLAEIKKKSAKNLEHIIVVDDGTSSDLPDGATHLFSQIISLGKQNVVNDVIALPDDLFSIVYTSGTTGSPKGVMLSQNNIASGTICFSSLISPNVDDEEDQVCLLSYLPLAHIFGVLIEMTVSSMGGRIAYFTGSVVRLVDDIQAAKITLLGGVPRIFIKQYNSMQAKVDALPFYKKWLFNVAYKARLHALQRGSKAMPAWTDQIAFNGMKALLGGRLAWIFNGAASLPFNIKEFLSVTFGTYFGEAYGMTETSGCISCAPCICWDPYNVGVTYWKMQMALESLPDMDYFVTDKPYPRGEIVCRGMPVFSGYYKDEESTRAAIGPDGFFHTGDVGMLVPGPFKDDEGKPIPSLRIIDRKKNIFKLAQGEFICAEHIQDVIVGGSAYVTKVIVYAPSSASSLVAILVPDWDFLTSETCKAETGNDTWAGGAIARYWDSQRSEAGSSSSASESASRAKVPVQQGGEYFTPMALRDLIAADPQARAFLLREVRRTCEAPESRDKVKKYEIPRGIVLCAEEWTDVNRCLTASLKTKREFIRLKYDAEIQVELARMEKEDREEQEKGGKGKKVELVV